MSDENVIEFPGETILDIPPQKILKAAAKADLDTVLILGWTKEKELYAAASCGGAGENILLVEQFKHELLSGAFK